MHAATARNGGTAAMHHALLHHLQLGSIRDHDWVSARFGHR